MFRRALPRYGKARSFNEAHARRRGKYDRRRVAAVPAEVGFNEAHARRRGKYDRRRVAAVPAEVGFNEAHARRRGKFADAERHQLRIQASMRPTPEGVGNPRTARDGFGRPACFNEAHARRRGKFENDFSDLGRTLLLQ